MIGQLLGNRYEILEKIGDGGMAFVYKARCKILNRIVAIKVLRDEFVDDDEFITKFANEALAAASLSHPNIVNIYDVGKTDKIHYIVMEYVDEGNLKDIIKEKGKIDILTALNITEQIAMALSQAHKKGIIHRDIKPHNILISKDGIAKVADFGIAKATTTSTITNMGNVIGSVHYFSPEQARGGYIDERSDLYSLGIVLYEMIVGKVPFKGDTPVNIALKHITENITFTDEESKNIPKDIKRMIFKLTNKVQADRYSNAEELIRDIKLIKNNDECNSFNDFEKEEYEDFSTQKLDIFVKNEKEGDKKIMARNKNKNNPSNKKTLFMAIVLALIVSVTLVASAYFLINIFMPKMYDTPNLKSLSLDSAKEKMAQYKIEIEVEKESFDSEVEKDHIIAQNPDVGSKIKKGDTIKVEISKGGEMVLVPNLLGEKLDDITDLLKEVELTEGSINEKDSSLEEGTVIEQKPRANTKVEKGTAIDIVVSKGKEEKLIKVPNLVGKSLEEARVELVGLGIDKLSYKEDKTKEEGIVLDQSIKSGQNVIQGSKIVLTVNQYKKDQSSDNSSSDSTSQKTPKTKKLSITLPEDKENVNVVVKETYKGNTSTIYSKIVNVKENGTSLTISIEGIDKKDYEIYIDDSLYGNVSVDFQ